MDSSNCTEGEGLNVLMVDQATGSDRTVVLALCPTCYASARVALSRGLPPALNKNWLSSCLVIASCLFIGGLVGFVVALAVLAVRP